MHAARDANDLRLGICSVDTDPALFDQAQRVELATEPTANYRHHTDAVQVGFDRFESEQSARTKFESSIADWAKKEKRTLYFVTASESEAARIAELLAENPLTAKLKPKYLHGTISGGFICQGSPTWLPLKQTKDSSGIVLITDTEYFGRQRRKISRTRNAPGRRFHKSINCSISPSSPTAIHWCTYNTACA